VTPPGFALLHTNADGRTMGALGLCSWAGWVELPALPGLLLHGGKEHNPNSCAGTVSLALLKQHKKK